MAWLKLTDGFAEHPKMVDLSDADFGRWVRLLLHAARIETDGYVTAGALTRSGVGPGLRDRLCGLGLLDREGEGWRVHDWLEYQPSREELERDRAKWREYRRRQRGYYGRRDHRMSTVDTTVDSTVESEGTSTVESRVPVPLNPARDGTAPRVPSTTPARGAADDDRGWDASRPARADELERAGDLLERAGLDSGEAAELALELALRLPGAELQRIGDGIPAHGLDPAGYVLESLRAAAGGT